MATTATLTGTFTLPNDAAPNSAVLSVIMSAMDTDQNTRDVLMDDGSFTVALIAGAIPAGQEIWKNTAGLRGTHYRATLAWTAPDGRLLSRYLGSFQVGDDASYDMADLLDQPPIATLPEGWYSTLTQGDYDAAIDARDQAAADRVQTGLDRTAAALSATQAALYAGPWLDDIAAMLADTALTYTSGVPGSVATGDYVQVRSGNYTYQVVSSGEAAPDIQTAGGVKVFYANPTVFVDAFGAVGDGSTNDTAAFQKAFDALGSGGGDVVLTRGKTYLASGITPRNNISVRGQNAKIKLPSGATLPIFYRHEEGLLEDFNLHDLDLDGSDLAVGLIQVTRPGATAPVKTWQRSTIDNCYLHNTGGIAVYCDIPGRVRIQNSFIYNVDIGLAWDREHMDVYHTQIDTARIGVRSSGNHFACVHMTIAHCTEAGWSMTGAGLGLYTNVFEGAFIGCTFIDCPIHVDGWLNRCRFVGCRHSYGTTNDRAFAGRASYTVFSGNTYMYLSDGALRNLGTGNVVVGNHFHGNPSNPSVGIEHATTGGACEDNLIVNNFFMEQSVAVNLAGTVANSRFVVGNTVRGNKITDCGSGIYLGLAREGNSVDENYLTSIGSGRGIEVEFTGAEIQQASVSGNHINACHSEAIKITHSSAIYSLSVDANQVLSANTANGADIDAISIAATSTWASSLCGNKVRNSLTAYARNAIRLSGGAADVLLDGNVSRNMKGTHTYKVPAVGVTQGTNIGTVDAT